MHTSCDGSTEPLIHYRSFLNSFKGRKKIALVAIRHFVFISGCEELTLSSATSQLIGSLRLLINFESSASPTLSVGLAGSMHWRFLSFVTWESLTALFLTNLSPTCIAPFALACKIVVHCLRIHKPASPITAAYRFCSAHSSIPPVSISPLTR